MHKWQYVTGLQKIQASISIVRGEVTCLCHTTQVLPINLETDHSCNHVRAQGLKGKRRIFQCMWRIFTVIHATS